jgi:hypothetical protein
MNRSRTSGSRFGSKRPVVPAYCDVAAFWAISNAGASFEGDVQLPQLGHTSAARPCQIYSNNTADLEFSFLGLLVDFPATLLQVRRRGERLPIM